GIMVSVDARSESVSKKVRESQLAQVNYSLVVGEKEEKDGTVTIRARNNEVIGAKKVDVFIKQLLKEVEEKK
ncbi:His/Gly/Thr/Pro-type tRNA ligase C-terminal domain-containing protein, partial [Nanoarchaeota archaeon]